MLTKTIEEKIAALLRVADSTNVEEERDAFLQKASQMLEQYSLSLSEIILNPVDTLPSSLQIGRVDISIPEAPHKIASWQRMLLASVGEFVGVKVFLQSSTKGIYVGRQVDISVAKALFSRLSQQLREEYLAEELLARSQDRIGAPSRGRVHVRTFCANFFSGAVWALQLRLWSLKDSREESLEESLGDQSRALVQVNESAIDTWVQEHFGVVKSTVLQPSQTSQTAGFQEGQQSGARIRIVDELGGGA